VPPAVVVVVSLLIQLNPQAVLTPVAGLFLTRIGFEKKFKTQWVFKTRRSALIAITCSKYRNNFMDGSSMPRNCGNSEPGTVQVWRTLRAMG